MKEPDGETRWNILDAAMKHFAEYGYRGASLANIAEDAGVSKSLIFWYFQSKESLFKSLIDRFVDNCIANLELNGPPGDARVKIEDLMDSYWDFIYNNFKFVRIFMNWFLQLDSGNKTKTKRLRSLHAKFREIFEHYLRQGVQEGLFRADVDIKGTALYIVCSLEGVLLQIVTDDLDFHDLQENFLKTLKKNMFDGLLSDMTGNIEEKSKTDEPCPP
jgi:TetR/AcrR family fatty acid metabolism transcriptional regulator